MDQQMTYNRCDIGFAILGGIIEVVSGQRHEEFMRDRVFDPLIRIFLEQLFGAGNEIEIFMARLERQSWIG